MRLFLAINLPDSVKSSLHTQLRPLQQEYRQFLWTPPENYHITIHFFGEVVPIEVSKIKEKMEQIVFDIPPFHLFALGCDLFIHRKIALYLAFKRNKMLEEIAEKVKREFQAHEPTQFISHLTVGRYKIPSKQQYLLLKKKLNNLPVDIEFPVNAVTLFESVPERKSPVYKNIADFVLAK